MVYDFKNPILLNYAELGAFQVGKKKSHLSVEVSGISSPPNYNSCAESLEIDSGSKIMIREKNATIRHE